MQGHDAASDRFVSIAILASLKFPFSLSTRESNIAYWFKWWFLKHTRVYKMLLCAAPLAPTLELQDMI